VVAKAIYPGEASPRVALLHKTLAVLGEGVHADEVSECVAGYDTQEKVRTIQERAGVRPGGGDVLVDARTQQAIAGALKDRGLAAAKRSFIVSGTVRDVSGRPVVRASVLAFDLDLRGIRGRREATAAPDLTREAGFEVLGEALTDARGAYSITFYDWQYSRAERGTADVVTFAVDARDEIVATSRVVRTEDYVDGCFVRDLDLVVVPAREDERTEYEWLRSLLDPFLAQNGVGLESLAGQNEEIAFTAAELDVEAAQVAAAADAAELVRSMRAATSSRKPGREDTRVGAGIIEPVYGLARQGIPLKWSALARRRDDELAAAIERAAGEGTIREPAADVVEPFLEQLRAAAARNALDAQAPDGGTVNEILTAVLPEAEQRQAYARAVATFDGDSPATFWTEHLPAHEPFKGNPELIAGVQVTTQLTAITGGHRPLIDALLVDRGVRSVDDLLALSQRDWQESVKQAGVPGNPDADGGEQARYAEFLAGTIDAAHPTRRIAQLVADERIKIRGEGVAAGVTAVLTGADGFNIATSRIDDVDEFIRERAGEHAPDVVRELKALQRIFQVSTSPPVMAALHERGLDSAHSIVSIPPKSFAATYGEALGGDRAAHAVHQRAAHVAGRAEMAAAKLMEVVREDVPASVMSAPEQTAAVKFLSAQMPGFTQLLGGSGMCECSHCSSVFSPSAYLVELLRFLWRGAANDNGETPLDVFTARRPDVVHLPLTCENATTILPYVDLANEVMERYTAAGTLTGFTGYGTGDATDAELRAHPQNSDIEAYRVLAGAVRPFRLPYHQPLDVIRAYSDQLGASRYDVMRALHPDPNAEESAAIAAERLSASPEEYALLTGVEFDGSPSVTPVHEAFGYGDAADLEQLHAVPEVLARAAVSYAELLDLVQTLFVNPHRRTLDFLQELLAAAALAPDDFYGKLKKIADGTLNPASDADVTGALEAYNDGRASPLTAEGLGTWLQDNFADFGDVVTLYEPQSRCDLETTELRAIARIYEGGADSGVTPDTWSRLHLFIRLWRRLGLTIHETDLLLAALGQDDVDAQTIERLDHALALRAAARLSASDLGSLWGSIDADGRESLYRRLFLNRAVQKIDDAFMPDAAGRYLTDEAEVLGDHRPALLAAFRLRDVDLEAILEVARVVEGGAPRALDLTIDPLTLPLLTTIYRHAVLARALKLKVADLCTAIDVLAASPFSIWDVDQAAWTSIHPAHTREFHERMAAYKELGLTAPVLAYAIKGERPADGRLGLDDERIRSAVRALRGSLVAIEQSHPSTPPPALTGADLGARLALTFQPALVTRLLAILDGTGTSEAFATPNLSVAIPAPLSARCTYTKASGRLRAIGVLTDAERTALETLPGADAKFQAAIDALYEDPATFLASQFAGVFTDMAEAQRVLLDRPPQPQPSTLEERLAYVHEHFVPVLKAELRTRTLAEHLGALLGTDAATTAALIGGSAEQLLQDLSAEGWSARYYSDPAWANPAVERVESAVDFDWALSAPDPAVPAEGFSASWDAFVLAPATGERTLVVEVAGADDAFRLSVDDTQILEKPSGDVNTSWEAIVDLDGGRSHRLQLDYADLGGTAGVSLRWKTATSGLEVLPPDEAYPAATIDEFSEIAGGLHRAAVLISRLGLNVGELRHLIGHAAEFDGLELTAPSPLQVDRLVEYVRLRNAVPQVNARLTDVFALAGANPSPSLDDVLALVGAATGWDAAAVDHLAKTQFGLAVADFTDEVALNRLRALMEILGRAGASAETATSWGEVTDDFDVLHATAQVLKRTVAAAYNEQDALDIAGQLSDTIRAHQRDALVAHLLTRAEIRDWGAVDADGLYEYLLIDVQMGSCMDTSRVVQASAAVQQFVNRCLLNLESVTDNGTEAGVSPAAIDRDRWEWMKQYRVWEANRKVFLYPENWLEPEWRMDRSELFRDLESYLVQNDVTDRTVEEALRAYLTSLDEVANLDVCGMHREDHDDGDFKCLHVFGHTHGAPYTYYHRTWDEYRRWSPWAKVPVDIRPTEDIEMAAGANSGVMLVPVVWKKRLFLFWPEFMRAPKGQTMGASSAEDVSDAAMSTLAAEENIQIRMARSELVDGKWTPKTVTREFIEMSPPSEIEVVERDYLFTPSIAATTQELKIEVSNTVWNILCGSFRLADASSPVHIEQGVKAARKDDTFTYSYEFGKRRGSAKLELEDDVYLSARVAHGVLPVNAQRGSIPRSTTRSSTPIASVRTSCAPWGSPSGRRPRNRRSGSTSAASSSPKR
jgi:hypothetical protein